jgi:alcohol dehydrogenase (cytochrome c)
MSNINRATLVVVAVVQLSFFTRLSGQSAPAGLASGDWPLYNLDYASTRYSKLSEVTLKNITGLRQVCSYALPEDAEFESGLVAVNGALYFTTAEYTYAIDGGNCAVRWRVRHPMERGGGTVRGVAFAQNRVFRGFPDGTVIAYNASNGEQVWSSKLTEPDGRPATISAAPITWNGMVFIGTFGAERACGCIVAGMDAATGKVLWTFALVPTGDAPGSETWPRGVHAGGGSVWTSLTIDPDTGELYVPTGNPGPDFSGAYRPGANLYTGSVVVLDARKGSLKTWYQLVPHDTHDWDQAATPAVITTRLGRRRAMAGGKDGYLHGIDIASGKVAWKTPVTTFKDENAPLTTQGTHFCPGVTGGVSWNGPAYSPDTNLVYVNSIDWCTTLKLGVEIPTFEPGKTFLGSEDSFGVHDARKAGWVTAVDADSGAVRWRYEAEAPLVSGIVVTASGLVMTVDLNGNFLAFDAQTGKLLHKIATGQSAGGGVITYLTGGKQRIAMATGLEDRILATHGKPAVLVYGP